MRLASAANRSMPSRLTTRLLGTCMAVAGGCLLTLPATTLSAAAVSEYEVKLALVYNVARFVTWPIRREHLSELSFCVYGSDPFGPIIEGIRGRKVRDRVIVVARVDTSMSDTERCDVLFVARSESEKVARVLERTADLPILTISDAPGFASAGGIVELQSRDSRVGFVINQSAYQNAELTVSSQLLQLATVVTAIERSSR